MVPLMGQSVCFSSAPRFLFPIPWFDHMTGPWKQAWLTAATALPLPNLQEAFARALCTPRWALPVDTGYPHAPELLASLRPDWLLSEAKLGLLWGGRQQSWAGSAPLGGGLSGELNLSQVVWMDHW